MKYFLFEHCAAQVEGINNYTMEKKYSAFYEGKQTVSLAGESRQEKSSDIIRTKKVHRQGNCGDQCAVWFERQKK